MRPLEILLVILIAICALSALAKRSPGGLLARLCAFEILTLVAHAMFEGPHWQLAPAYLAALLIPIVITRKRPLVRRLLACTSILLALTAATFSTILPMFRLPAPTGPYAIGTRIFHLVNEHPSDLSYATNGKRELMIQVWYPALTSHAPRAAYRRFAETTRLSSYQAVLWTHARWNAPFAPIDSPLLLLNPAANGRRTYYMYLVEDLVSHGYIVAGIDHTGNSGPTAFPDGHISQPIPDPGLDFVDQPFAQLLAYGAKLQGIQVNDDRFVLDQLEAWTRDANNPFYQRIDMQRVGALGHSIGGSVAAQAACDDSRILSALDMDGSIWGTVQQKGLAKPFLLIEEDVDDVSAERLKDRYVYVSHLLDLRDLDMMNRSNGYHIHLHGSTHVSYTDQVLYSPVKRLSGIGAIPALREFDILRAYVLSFFDKTLRGADPALLKDNSQPYPEAGVVFHHGPQP